MRYLALLLILLIPISAYSADGKILMSATGDVLQTDTVINGKVGKVIADKPILDTVYYKADATISDTILMGRAIVDAHRARNTESWKVEMTHEDRVVTSVSRIMDTRRKLKAWGFNSEKDLIDQSKVADNKAGIKPGEGWK